MKNFFKCGLIQEGGWKGSGYKTRTPTRQSNCDEVWSTLQMINVLYIVLTFCNFNKIAQSHLQIQRNIAEKPTVKISSFTVKFGIMP